MSHPYRWKNHTSISRSWVDEKIILYLEILSTPALELLSVESYLLGNIHVYFSDIVDTFGIAKSRKCL